MAEVLCLASLVETFAEPLLEAGFEPLLIYVNGVRSFAYGDLKGATAQLEQLHDQQYWVEVAGVNLDISEAYKVVDAAILAKTKRLLSPGKILVVDDEPSIRNLIFRFLGKKNYQMEDAEDGKTALALFEEFLPDLVILDINLPDADGYNLCQEMQSRTGVFILMLTSHSEEADKIRGFAEGADDYLTKPFGLRELEARVKAVLRRN